MNWEKSWINVSESSKSGGQGEVFKLQNKLDKSIFGALKIMHESQAKSSKRKARFEKEIDALKKIKNENVPKILESDINTAIPYFISEWIDGEDLSEFLTKNNFTIPEALLFSRKLALIVDSCHQEGIVHRDIKPQNIRVKNGEPILIDFGICWTSNESESRSGKTPVGEELGNRFLRLPELTSGSIVKHEKVCDVTFVVGILFYLITKKPPRQLKDSDNKMPQERLTSLELSKLQEKDEWQKTNRIFNIGFQQSFKFRFDSCIDLINSIDKILDPKEEMSINEEFDESKKRLHELINTDELKQKRNAVEKFKSLNDKLYKEIIQELSGNGTSVSNNENFSDTSNKKNMYIRNNMFPEAQTILSHFIGIVDNKINCAYSIRNKDGDQEISKTYYIGHVTDLETLEESINKNKTELLNEAINSFSEQLKK